jgi:hypothetical protein
MLCDECVTGAIGCDDDVHDDPPMLSLVDSLSAGEFIVLNDV